MVGVSLWDLLWPARKRCACDDGGRRRGEAMSGAILESVLTCPNCDHAKRELMSTESCQFFYQCESCKALLRPKAGDCCVFCSFGSVKCPPVQQRAPCCSDARAERTT
jgi:hypothetical protein